MKTRAAFLVFLLAAAPAAGALTQKAYTRRMQAQLDNLSRQLRELDRRENEVRSEDKERFKERLNDLWRRERKARVDLEAIRHAPASRWQDLKKKEDPTVISLTKSYRKLLNRYLK